MLTSGTRAAERAEVAKRVEEIRQEFARDVVRIRFDVDEDWTGVPAIFFRVLLTDRASRGEKRRRTTKAVAERLRQEPLFDDFGARAYFNFRNVSEQAELKDPEWA